MAVGDVYKFLVRFTRSGNAPCVNQFHYVLDVDPGPAVLGQIMSSFNSGVIPALRTFHLANVTIEKFETTKVSVLPLPLPTTTVVNLLGLRSVGSNFPTVGSVCGIISRKTGFLGQRNRGRIYLPFSGETDWTGAGVASANYTTAMNTLVTTLQAALPTGGGGLPVGTVMVPCLWHRPTGPFVRVSVHTPRTYSGVQRSRLGDRWP